MQQKNDNKGTFKIYGMMGPYNFEINTFLKFSLINFKQWVNKTSTDSSTEKSTRTLLFNKL